LCSPSLRIPDDDFILPADHGPEATQYLKAFIGHHYVYSDEPVFKALWNSYNKCQFVDNEGEHMQLECLRKR
jgi:hypothetical protein